MVFPSQRIYGLLHCQMVVLSEIQGWTVLNRKDQLMITLYSVIKTIHILTAIVALGFNLSYPLWFFKGKKEDTHLLFALKGIKMLDDRFANPGYILSLITGLLLCYIGHLDILHTFWLLGALILFAFAAGAGILLYSPVLNKQIKVLTEEGSQSATYKRLDRRQTAIGAMIFIFALAILFLMVTKP